MSFKWNPFSDRNVDCTALSALFFVLGILIAVVAWAAGSENKIIDPVAIPDSPLRTIVQQLSDKIDLLGLEDIKTKDQIKALRAADGVSREQTKYLTATVNKANFGS